MATLLTRIGWAREVGDSDRFMVFGVVREDCGVDFVCFDPDYPGVLCDYVGTHADLERD